MSAGLQYAVALGHNFRHPRYPTISSALIRIPALTHKGNAGGWIGYKGINTFRFNKL